jgi:hypothetical protein
MPIPVLRSIMQTSKHELQQLYIHPWLQVISRQLLNHDVSVLFCTRVIFANIIMASVSQCGHPPKCGWQMPARQCPGATSVLQFSVLRYRKSLARAGRCLTQHELPLEVQYMVVAKTTDRQRLINENVRDACAVVFGHAAAAAVSLPRRSLM